MAIALAAAVGFVAAPASAETIEVDIAQTALSGDPGSTVQLGSAEVAPELVGRSCSVAITVTNQVSENPGNKLVVSSGDSGVEVPGIEEAANAVTTASGTLTLGPTINVSIVLGPSTTMTSLGSSLVVTCELLPEPPPSAPVVTTPTYSG